MISLWHLLWIIPVAFLFGYFTCGVLAAGVRADEEYARMAREEEK